jgi:F0F1-type ATP synthase delta subunit
MNVFKDHHEKSQLCDFILLQLKLAHFDGLNTIQKQLQATVAELKHKTFVNVFNSSPNNGLLH